ncbi:hypothetical protein ABH931_001792 [Streptacidiphilus sp. MAP12-33]|uniref:hypothetical protein n=1 Tax=Streptacidiphilus sp. MAP12-33 TaxID=3156266 RepID=UPI0035129FB1
MGIESEQLVYDYLSRVGDLAGQSGGLTAAQRARLVNELRQSIDSQRAASSPSSTRAEVNSVRKILAGLGTPDEVVGRASGGGRWATSGPSVPRQGASSGPVAPSVQSVPSRPYADATPSIPAQGQPPGVEGRVEYINPEANQTLTTGVPWWTGEVEGVVHPGAGGVRMVQPPGWSGAFDRESPTYDGSVIHPLTGRPVGLPGGLPGETPGQQPGSPPEAIPQPSPGLLRRLLGAQPAAPGAGAAAPVPVAQAPRAPMPFVESLATLVLAAGAVTGLWYLAVLGWLFAYGSRRLGRGVGRFASLWIPGLLGAACGFWLYSRGHTSGHPALTNAQFAAATHNAFAFWLRASAGLSAAFLAWRITRR